MLCLRYSQPYGSGLVVGVKFILGMGKGGGEKQIPSLRCGMTNKERVLRCAKDDEGVRVVWSEGLLEGMAMNRRDFLVAGAALPSAFLETPGQITHVDTVRDGVPLKSSVVKGRGLAEVGDSPGAKAKVHFNGRTAQLAAVASGLVTLEPGARPHPPHRHPEEEFMMIGVGTGEIVVDGVTTQVEAGDMMYAEANVLHGITNTGSSMMTFYFIKIMAKG
jgi:quercetin dioxygenase-like cupin family protein